MAKVSIPSNGSSLFQYPVHYSCSGNPYRIVSQSPQTGQVYFNFPSFTCGFGTSQESQSPQTGQVYFNESHP